MLFEKTKTVMMTLVMIICQLSQLSLLSAQESPFGTDTFGITRFYPTKEGSREWNSAHWGNGIERNVRYARDPYDPTDWTEDHSAGTNGFQIDGNGVMNMSGGGPRFHINSLRTTKGSSQFFLNVEFTGYYRRIGTSGANYGGMVVGVRSGPLGHGSSGGDDCDATTYYARFRHDGKWDFEKELKHPSSDYWSSGGFHTQAPLWGGRQLPENRWIGMKYLVYNIDNDSKVKLELFIDSTTNGEATDGGKWEKVGEVIDDGNWPAASGTITGCSYSDPHTIITEGHGTILMRTDGDGADYKKVTIREIDLGTTSVLTKYTVVNKNKPELRVFSKDEYNLLGRVLGKGIKKPLREITVKKSTRLP